METLLTTLLAAFIIIIICVLLLGISLILTGKSRLRIGMCGKTPTKKRSKENGCGTESTCTLCGKNSESKNEEE